MIDQSPQSAFRTAQMNLERLRKKASARRKHNLVEVPFCKSNDTRDVVFKVQGSKGWAKLEQGTVKVVKRIKTSQNLG
jgi:protein subunit release factor B